MNLVNIMAAAGLAIYKRYVKSFLTQFQSGNVISIRFYLSLQIMENENDNVESFGAITEWPSVAFRKYIQKYYPF